LQHHAALAQRHDLCVRCRVMTANRAIPPFANNAIFMHQYRAHGHFTFIPGTLRELKRMLHPVFMGKLSF